MSILINGMEMPRTHPITVEIYPDGTVLSKTVGRRDIHGTAAPVPPHGRLGDLDALSKALRDEALQHTIIGDLNRMALGAGEVIDRLNNATTIIPAEEGDT